MVVMFGPLGGAPGSAGDDVCAAADTGPWKERFLQAMYLRERADLDSKVSSHTHAHTRSHTYMHAHIHTRMHVCTHTNTCTTTNTHTRTH